MIQSYNPHHVIGLYTVVNHRRFSGYTPFPLSIIVSKSTEYMLELLEVPHEFAITLSNSGGG